MNEIRKALAQWLLGLSIDLWPDSNSDVLKGYDATVKAMGEDARRSLKRPR